MEKLSNKYYSIPLSLPCFLQLKIMERILFLLLLVALDWSSLYIVNSYVSLGHLDCFWFLAYLTHKLYRYVRNLPTNQSFNVAHFNMQKIQPPFLQYDPVFSPLGQMPRAQTSLSYGPPPSPIMNPFCAIGLNPTARDAAYMQWSTAAIMYAQSYEQSRHAGFQVSRFTGFSDCVQNYSAIFFFLLFFLNKQIVYRAQMSRIWCLHDLLAYIWDEKFVI